MTERGQQVLATFTAKESVVAALIGTGARNKSIAHQLGTTEQVIKNYCARLFDKTGTNSKLQFTLFCQDHGIIEVPKRPEAADASR